MSRNITENIQNDLWSYLSATDKRIVMYGMGNGADKILGVCKRYGIEVSDFFASDGFVRGHSFHGKVVLSYSDVKEKYGCENLIVLLSFASSIDSVIENIRRIDSECELYAPDVPVFGDEIFTLDYYLENQDKFDSARSLFADSESVRIFDSMIKYKLTGKISYLLEAESEEGEMYGILGASSFRSAADLGAYNGDSVRKLLEYSPMLSKVFALEPDGRNYRKLCEYANSLIGAKLEVIPINKGAWSHARTAYFDVSGNRNAGVACNTSAFAELGSKRKIKEVSLDSLDSILDKTAVDYVKYDVEGSEQEAILGSFYTIKDHSPSLLVSAYHRSGDLFALPLLVHEINPAYRLYLRRLKYIPAWDINLLAVK